MRPHYGINRRDLDRILFSIGGTVSNVRRTGEIRYAHSLMLAQPRADGRRKDAAHHLVDFVREAIDRWAERCADPASSATLRYWRSIPRPLGKS